jgi:hypothetical protein
MDQNDILQKYWFFKPDSTLQNNLISFGFETGPGWNSIIDELCSKIEVLLDTKYPECKENFSVLQVKSKYATLRFYVSGAPDEIYDLINTYEDKTETICEECGSTSAMTRSHYGWYTALCDDCEVKSLENHKKK